MPLQQVLCTFFLSHPKRCHDDDDDEAAAPTDDDINTNEQRAAIAKDLHYC